MAEYQKCNNCKGTGRVPSGSRFNRWTSCPICHGTGKKLVKKPDFKRKG